MQRTLSIRDKIASHVHLADALKKDLETYLRDDSTSLDQRWEVYVDAPLNLKNHMIEGMKLPRVDLIYFPGGNHLLVNVLNYRENEIIDPLEMLDQLQEMDDRDRTGTTDWKLITRAVKEELMQQNVGTFLLEL